MMRTVRSLLSAALLVASACAAERPAPPVAAEALPSASLDTQPAAGDPIPSSEVQRVSGVTTRAQESDTPTRHTPAGPARPTAETPRQASPVIADTPAREAPASTTISNADIDREAPRSERTVRSARDNIGNGTGGAYGTPGAASAAAAPAQSDSAPVVVIVPGAPGGAAAASTYAGGGGVVIADSAKAVANPALAAPMATSTTPGRITNPGLSTPGTPGVTPAAGSAATTSGPSSTGTVSAGAARSGGAQR